MVGLKHCEPGTSPPPAFRLLEDQYASCYSKLQNASPPITMPTMSRVESFLPPFETFGSGLDEIGLEVGCVGNAHTDASGRPHKPGLPMYEAAGNLDSVVGTAPDKLLLATLNTDKLTIFNGGMLSENELLRRFSSESEEDAWKAAMALLKKTPEVENPPRTRSR